MKKDCPVNKQLSNQLQCQSKGPMIFKFSDFCIFCLNITDLNWIPCVLHSEMLIVVYIVCLKPVKRNKEKSAEWGRVLVEKQHCIHTRDTDTVMSVARGQVYVGSVWLEGMRDRCAGRYWWGDSLCFQADACVFKNCI